jgi:hypothetical protein
MLRNQLRRVVGRGTKRYIKLMIKKKKNLNNISKIRLKLDEG